MAIQKLFPTPPNVDLVVYWDGAAIATVNGNEEGVIEAIETATREHSCFTSVKIVDRSQVLDSYRDVQEVDVEIDDDGDVYKGTIELSSVTRYVIHKK